MYAAFFKKRTIFKIILVNYCLWKSFICASIYKYILDAEGTSQYCLNTMPMFHEEVEQTASIFERNVKKEDIQPVSGEYTYNLKIYFTPSSSLFV